MPKTLVSAGLILSALMLLGGCGGAGDSEATSSPSVSIPSTSAAPTDEVPVGAGLLGVPPGANQDCFQPVSGSAADPQVQEFATQVMNSLNCAPETSLTSQLQALSEATPVVTELNSTGWLSELVVGETQGSFLVTNPSTKSGCQVLVYNQPPAVGMNCVTV